MVQTWAISAHDLGPALLAAHALVQRHDDLIAAVDELLGSRRSASNASIYESNSSLIPSLP